MRVLRIVSLALSLILPLMAFSAKEKVVKGSYTYYLPYNEARDKGEQIALERAMIQAIADEFGTLLTQHSQLDIRSSKNGEYSDFWSSASSMVRGEWVETIGRPTFTPYIEDGKFVIKCEVKGVARELTAHKAELNVKFLRNGTTDAYESTTFESGDNCYLAVTTPVKGAIAVYLEDESKSVACLLPYYSQSEACVPITPGERHIYFASSDGDMEKYTLLTDKEIERNVVYVIFSQNEFIKPIDHSTGEELSLKVLGSEDFHSWLKRSRAKDPSFQVITIPITIVSRLE